ncbi:hypothetical protein KY339_02790 [Candidatus Woesearchaeota archaeon]|nr:hypothetical protein [Candidatus Woesearchaeota archaeon]
MNKRGGWDQLIKPALILLVVAVVLIIFAPKISGPVNKLLGLFGFGGEEIEPQPGEYPFFDKFVEEYKACKYSPDTGCYCSMSELGSNPGLILEIINTPPSTVLNLHVGKIEYNRFADNEFISERMLKSVTIPSNIKDDLWIPNNRFDHDFTDGELDFESFQHTTQHLFRLSAVHPFGGWVHSSLKIPGHIYVVFTEDIEGFGDIMDYGGLFKFDDTKIAILNHEDQVKETSEDSYNNLVKLKENKCSVPKDIVPSIKEFDNLVEKVNLCILDRERLGLTPATKNIPVCHCDPIELEVPEDWFINLHPKGEDNNYLLLFNPKVLRTAIKEEKVKSLLQKIIVTRVKEGNGWKLYPKSEFGTSVKEIGKGKHTVYPVINFFSTDVVTGNFEFYNLLSLEETEPYYVKKCEKIEPSEGDDSLAEQEFEKFYSGFGSELQVSLPKEYFIRLVQNKQDISIFHLIKDNKEITARIKDINLCTFDGSNEEIPLLMANINSGKVTFNDKDCLAIQDSVQTEQV